jgi:hypothetical protein
MDKILNTDKPTQGAQGGSTALEDQARELFNNAKVNPNSSCDRVQTPKLTLDGLAHANDQTLSCIYQNAKAGAIPSGDTTGRAIFMPGSEAGDLISKLGNHVWTGKVFGSQGDLVNKIFGHKLIHADVHKGTSWFDGKESIIIDYKGKSLAAGWVRDEIREVKPGLYLGKMYARLPFHQHTDVLYFALETNKKAKH